MKFIARLQVSPRTSHSYEVEVRLEPCGPRYWLSIEANNRTQAAALAKRCGFDVCSVGMTG